MNPNQLSKDELLQKTNKELVESRAVYIEEVNKEREATNYLLSVLDYIKNRVNEIKSKYQTRSFRFWLAILFDSKIRRSIKAILEFDYEYVESLYSDNRRERDELSKWVQELSLNQDKKSTTLD